jgi:hypothetical protein
MLRIFTIITLLASFSISVHGATINIDANLYTPTFCDANTTICDTSTNHEGHDKTVWGFLGELDLVYNYDWSSDTDSGKDGFEYSYSPGRFLNKNGDRRGDEGFEIQYISSQPSKPSIDCYTVNDCWAVVKGGNHDPARYLFNLGLAGLNGNAWNGTDTLRFDNFWNGEGQISHVAIYTGSTSAVPVPATIWLFGTALIGFIGVSRRTKI